MSDELEKLSQIDPADRVMLLSYCLRPSQTCPGKMNSQGLECPEDCAEDCVLGRLRRMALALGYKGVCIAAGGRMALRFVKEQQPRGIVAVACPKELAEGVDGVRQMATDERQLPTIAVIPLTKDGCVDTEVDEGLAREVLSTGCLLASAADGGSTSTMR